MGLLNKKPKEKEKEVKKLNISVCIITKDDAELIEDCIKSVQSFAREIIVYIKTFQMKILQTFFL